MAPPRLNKKCTVAGCDGAHKTAGLCSRHHGVAYRARPKASCSVDGCTKPESTLGMCGQHYQRLRKYGDPHKGRTPNGERRAFILNFEPPDTDECIDWPFGIDALTGYGHRMGGQAPHVLICERFHGEKPTPEHEVAHKCGRRPCIHPRHIKWSTHLDNMADQVGHGTRLRGESHPAAKLTEELVLEIRSLPLSISHTQLARRYGVNASTISEIRSGKIWAHVPGVTVSQERRV